MAHDNKLNVEHTLQNGMDNSVRYDNRIYDSDLDFATKSTTRLTDLPPVTKQPTSDNMQSYNPFEHRDKSLGMSDSGSLLHMLKCSLGSGILAMPNAFKNAGLVLGTFGTVIVGILCTYCVHMLVRSSQVLSTRTRQPKLDFAQTAAVAFQTGPTKYRKMDNFARHFVNISLFFTYFLGNTVYVVFIASSFKQVIDNHFESDFNIRLCIVIMAIPLIILGVVRHLRSMVIFSALATVLIFVGIAFTLYFTVTDLPDITERHYVAPLKRFPLFFSTVLFAMEGIGTVLPIENAMKKPHHFLASFGVLNIAMLCVIIFYSCVGFTGYLKYGEETKGSITLNLPLDLFSETIKICVALSILFTYGLQFVVPCEIVWEIIKDNNSVAKNQYAYYIMRTSMIIGTVIIAAIIPNLGPIISLVGAVCFSLLGLFVPAVIDHITFYDPAERFYSPRIIKNFIIAAISIGALISGTYYSVEEIIEFYSKNPFFHS